MQVASLPDQRLCNIHNKQSRQYDPTSRALMRSEIVSRGLNCDPMHRSCISYGYKLGSKDYGDCMLQLRRMALEQQQMESLMEGLKELKQTPSADRAPIMPPYIQ